MIILISSAKTMEFEKSYTEIELSKPVFIDEAERLMDLLRSMGSEEIKKVMKINDKLAEINSVRFKEWRGALGKSHKQAILAFKGEVYKSLKADSFSAEDLYFAKDKVKILSGLYGLLNALDGIMPYRLEMASKFNLGDKKDLYDFWTDIVSSHILHELASHQTKYVINLASEEYSRIIDTKRVAMKNIVFKELKDGQLKVVPTYSKKARGLMTNYIILNRIDNVEALKSFKEDGYVYKAEFSNENNLIFIRE